MAEIIKFETAAMAASRVARENKPELEKSAVRMQLIIDSPRKSTRAKIEARMAKAIFEGDDASYSRCNLILERLARWQAK